jgi:hypothetical protein
MNKSLETLANYEELKGLYIKYIGTSKRLKKVLNKSPKQFINYINKHFIIKENFKVVVLGLEDGSEFWTVKETKQRAEETKAKFETCEKVSVKIELNKYLLLK